MDNGLMLARLLRLTLVLTALTGLGWCLFWWTRAPVLALAGLAVIWGGHILVLTVQFACMGWWGGTLRVARPARGVLLKAACTEWGQAVRVFGWRQPFRSNQIPNQLLAKPSADAVTGSGRRGVVLVHGFACNRGFWTPWLDELRARAVAYEALDLEPVFASIDGYVAQVDAAVERVRAATGQAPVLLCHSMGGLVARAWLRTVGDLDRIRHIVTIATPHRGTWIARFSQMPNGRQMRLHSPWIEALALGETVPRRTKFTCWYSDCDNIVFPFETAMLPDAHSRFVAGQAHLALAFHPTVMAETLDSLVRDAWPSGSDRVA